MKKIVLTTAMAICTFGLFAQTAAPAAAPMMDKKGEMYLPEAGDWAIAFDATPFLQYVGNFLSGATTTNQAPTLNFIGGSSGNYNIVGKYFTDPNTAYRGILRIGFSSNSLSALTPQDQAPAGNPPAPTVTDKLSIASHFIGLGAGMEKRKGHTRLQGYYGAELMFWISSAGNDSSMTYGNSYSQTGTGAGTSSTPAFHNFGNGTTETYGLASGGRITADNPGSVFGISIQGFIGVEYFILPKISLGGEYTWGINFWSQGQSTLTVEQIYTPNGGGNPVDANVTTHSGTASHFGVDTGVNPMFGNATNLGSADLNIIFHF